jgi:hypothetical protein
MRNLKRTASWYEVDVFCCAAQYLNCALAWSAFILTRRQRRVFLDQKNCQRCKLGFGVVGGQVVLLLQAWSQETKMLSGGRGEHGLDAQAAWTGVAPIYRVYSAPQRFEAEVAGTACVSLRKRPVANCGVSIRMRCAFPLGPHRKSGVY